MVAAQAETVVDVGSVSLTIRQELDLHGIGAVVWNCVRNPQRLVTTTTPARACAWCDRHVIRSLLVEVVPGQCTRLPRFDCQLSIPYRTLCTSIHTNPHRPTPTPPHQHAHSSTPTPHLPTPLPVHPCTNPPTHTNTSHTSTSATLSHPVTCHCPVQARCFTQLLGRDSDAGCTVRGLVAGQRVVELGSGTGVVGLAVAAAGASSVLLSDLPELATLVNQNIDLNAAACSPCAVSFRVIDWYACVRSCVARTSLWACRTACASVCLSVYMRQCATVSQP